MSRYPDEQPETHSSDVPVVDTVIVPRPKDLGGFSVRRVLPAAERRNIGSFVFLDHMGPADFPAGHGIDVRPHPHIGLATVTYLFQGRIMHRDSLGSVQPIVPGDVNWMTAGRGIVHSERSDAADRLAPQRLQGLQLWVALPLDQEDAEPGFAHHDAAALPSRTIGGAQIRVIAGTAFGLTSPVETLSPLFFADVTLPAGETLELDADYAERAVYVTEGEVTVSGDTFAAGRMMVFHPGSPAAVTAVADARLAFLGGAPLDAPRHLWWNFVASDRARIDAAKAAWASNRFGLSIAGDEEFIPLPD
jgi:redox-sensitive bicupin YhaK (pirin superfamily)